MGYSCKVSTDKIESVEEFLARTNSKAVQVPEGMRTMEVYSSLKDEVTLSTFGRLDRLTGGTMTDKQLLVMAERDGCE
jgi:hypothetical protein